MCMREIRDWYTCMLAVWWYVCERKRKRKRPFGGEFIELSLRGENDKANFSITQHRELLSLLQKPCSPLAEGNLPMHRVLNSPQLNLSTSHSWWSNEYWLINVVMMISISISCCVRYDAHNLPLVWTSFEVAAANYRYYRVSTLFSEFL